MNSVITTPSELSSILEAIPEPAAILAGDYKILATNSSYLEHHELDSVKGSDFCYQVTHGYNRPCDESGESCPLQRCQKTGSRQRVLHLHQTPNGPEHVDVEMRPLKMADGSTCFLEIMHQVKVAQASPEGQGLIGCSDAFNAMLGMIQRAGPSDISVLLLGESGTGKELAAKALHSLSYRAQSPFVTVECSGLNETLFESEMFGHEKGAFTGAITRKDGLVSAARGGTLFLDEVGDIPLSLQVKLLRLIETGTYRRVGGLELKHADFRLVCATHKNLKAMVECGEFREDLYYRISTFPIELPALRERREDIPLLIQAIFRRLDGAETSIDEQALHALKTYAFPGNIRELRNLLERALLLTDNGVIGLEQLPEYCRSGSETLELQRIGDRLIPLADLESSYLRTISQQFKGNKKALADALGISERTLYRKLSQL